MTFRLTDTVVRQIRAEMDQQRVTGGELARKLDWSRPRLHRRLHGETALNTDEIDDIAQALGVPAAKLLVSGQV